MQEGRVMCLWDVQLCMISLLYMVCNCNTFIIYQPLSTLFYFFVWKLIVFIHYNSKLWYFPITKISRGVMIFIPKNYFTHKCINLITLLDIIVIEKYSNFELWWINTINIYTKNRRVSKHALMRVLRGQFSINL